MNEDRRLNIADQGATRPDDLGRMIVERLNDGDLDGLVALYEPDAVLALPDGGIATGSREIRLAFEAIVASGARFAPGVPQPTVRCGDLALTSTRLPGGAVTVEVARRQPDGTWLWVIDQPNITGPTITGGTTTGGQREWSLGNAA